MIGCFVRNRLLVDDTCAKAKYQHLITNSFVECNRLMRWCPAPNCSNAIKAHYFAAQPVKCHCSRVFCFGCGKACHEPITCDLLNKWLNKCKMLKNNITFHPYREFLQEWINDHEQIRNIVTENQEISPDVLKRFTHYCMCSMKHYMILKHEKKIERMQQQRQYNKNFLEETAKLLCLCRQTLIYTYAFAYFLKSNNQSIIFENNLSKLENAVEALDNYLKQAMSSANGIVTNQTHVSDKYMFCEQRRKALLDHMHEGYQKDLWEFNE